MIKVFLGRFEDPTKSPWHSYTNKHIFFADDLSGEELLDISASNNLFSEPKFIVIYNLFSNEDLFKFFLKNYKQQDASNFFFLVADKINARQKQALVSLGAEVISLDNTKKSAPVKKSDPFLITNAILRGSRSEAWLAYQRAIMSGSTPEALSGAIWWQLKSVLLYLRLNDKSGLNPFVVGKIKTSVNKLGRDYFEKQAWSFLQMFHLSRFEGSGLNNALEGWLLQI